MDIEIALQDSNQFVVERDVTCFLSLAMTDEQLPFVQVEIGPVELSGL